jgi:multidrug efflux pump subunit AcrB
MIRFFVRHPNAANLLMIASCILGLSVVTEMEREALPEFTPSRISVSVLYPGASAVDVDEGICQELNGGLSNVPDLKELKCQSTEGRAAATLTMAQGGDITQFFNDTLSEVSALSDLPQDAQALTAAVAARDDLIGLVTISGIEGTDSLQRYADELAATLGALSIVSDAAVSGSATANTA